MNKNLKDELKQFGNYFSLIDINGLLKELKTYFYNTKQNISIQAYFAKYAKEDKYATYNATFKKDTYSYQNEFRIILHSDDFLNLGEMNPYITDKSKLNIRKYFSEPTSIDNLFNAKTITDINSEFN